MDEMGGMGDWDNMGDMGDMDDIGDMGNGYVVQDACHNMLLKHLLTMVQMNFSVEIYSISKLACLNLGVNTNLVLGLP